MATAEEAATQLKDVWNTWTLGRKAFVTVGSIGAIAIVFSLLFGGEPSNMVPLMADMTMSDANDVTNMLDGMKVPYKLAKGGTAILVPADRVHKVRMALAAEGLPKGGGVGYEIFDDPAFGMSRFTEKLNYKRGLEGELRRTIQSMAAVKDARVHIVLPKRSLFKDREESATASITLQLERGRRLTEDNVQAVVHLVSSSVEGLNSDYVTVVDSAGKVLARGEGDASQVGKGLEEQRKMERDLERRVTRIIERIVGPGRASVQVSAELDYTQSEVTQENYDPEGSAIRSEQKTEEQSFGNADGEAGLPGARANVVGGPAEVGAAGAPGSDLRTAATTNYEVSKTIRREVAQVARMKRLSVAVLVDEAVTKDADGNDVNAPRPQEELDQIMDLVRKAVGYNVDRGDEVTVVSMPFTQTQDEIELTEPPPRSIEDWINLLWKPVLGLLCLLVLLGVMRSMKKMSEGVPTPILETPQSVRDLEAALSAAGHGTLGPGEDAQVAAAAMKNTRPDPEKAAAVIKGWLTEG